MNRRHVLRPRPLCTAIATALGAYAPHLLVAQESASASDNSDNSVQEVLVTGSRIVRRDYTATSPIVTVGSENFERSSSVGIETSLNQLPQFQPGATQFDNASDITATAFGGVGAATVNLRGLGTNRTLVLIDGRRAEPADATLVVDVNSIPSAAIDRVEVITGGASAVYGADALAGVVNFILKKDFQGLTVDAQSSVTQEGDGQETRINALFGSKSADGKGSVMIGADFSRRGGIAVADRAFYVDGEQDPGTPASALGLNIPRWRPSSPTDQPSQAALNAVYGAYPAGTASPLAYNYFNTDGTLFQTSPNINYKGTDPTIVTRTNGTLSGVFNPALLSAPLQRYSIFGRGNYDFNENLTAYVQANFSSTQVQSRGNYAPAVTFWGASIPANFTQYPVPPALQTLLQSRANPTAPWFLDQEVNDIPGEPAEGSTTTSDVYQVLVGLKGNITPIHWTWDVYASEGRTTTLTSLDQGFISLQNYLDIIQAPYYGAGYTNTTGSSYGYGNVSCTSGLNPFSILAGKKVSQDCLNALNVTMKNYSDFEQQIFEANTQGALFQLPAGAVRAALGASYRKDTISFQPDRLLEANDVSEQQIGLYAVSSTAGSTNVKEAYSELLVPVLHNIPLVKEFDLELGGRYSDYNTAGGQDTWKALFDWTATDYVSFRGGLQRAARAPNTAELFSGATVQTVAFAPGDPCASNTQAPYGNVASNPNRAKVQGLCQALIGNTNTPYSQNPNTFVGPFGFFPNEIETLQGNTKLQPEIARTWTLGTVLHSPFDSPALSKLTASLDWYNINIAGLIAPQDPVTTYADCLNANGVSNPTYSPSNPDCMMIQRDPITGDRHSVDAPYVNTGGLKTSGLDVELNWHAGLNDIGFSRVPGSLSLDYLFNYIQTYQTQATPGAPWLEYAGTIGSNLGTSPGEYRWRSFTTLGYDISSWTVHLTWQHLSSARNAAVVQTPGSTVLGTPSYNLYALAASWQLNDTVALRAGIDNLFNAQPLVVGANPPLTNSATTTLPDYYDVLGRRFYLGVKLNF